MTSLKVFRRDSRLLRAVARHSESTARLHTRRIIGFLYETYIIQCKKYSLIILNKANRFTPTHSLYGELAWCISRYRRWVNIVHLWNRLILMPEDRLAKRVLCWDWEICHKNWCADVKEIFEEVELEYCFNEMCPVNINMFRNLMIILRSEKT